MDTIWTLVRQKFAKYPAQAKVAKALISMGLCVSNRKIYCGDIEMSVSALARSLNVDRRIITHTVHTIMKDRKLKEIFGTLEPICALHKAAKIMKWSVLEIQLSDDSNPGLLGRIANEIGAAGVDIRQVFGMDPRSDTGKLFIITESEVPASTIMRVRKLPGVQQVII